ncbi:hypothetical protein [Corynebacterium variabile]|uniref:hypothetical protein n=1 Tax=Corynebacterium variabile TaxID=1727 RepID=UPI00264A158F|nr:hypothetical protein [Corynebacterium variabile]MDN6241735.1 hypothetical protein [Corynebacterium variabile]MDN6478553.1 hypothetical protein [Corynebacterium variabile]MDN6676888.1 hypothetical protein [Corynebacterium variabile]MDN6845491.1 hypothetical protein [Corynebacterium variabile]
MTDIPGIPGALDRVLADQAHRYAAMLVANHALGSLDAVDTLTHALAGRPDLVPGVVTRLLDQMGGDPNDED